MINVKFLILLILLFNIFIFGIAVPQDNSKYHGGSYDGFSNGNISQTSLDGSLLNTNKYFGGSYDGFSLNNISQTSLNGTSANLAKYFGGSFDGFSLNNILQSSLNGTTINLAKYFGGSFDGFSLNNISQSSLNGTTINLAKYFGGSFDGFSLNIISQTSLGGSTINLAKYFGGSYDGFSLVSIVQTSLGGISINLAKYFGGSYDGLASTLVNQNPLNISLESFTFAMKKNNINLNWITKSEINNRGFDIQRLKPGEDWINLGFVISKGTINTQQNYSFEDKKLSSGKYKYRLKQTDYNGNIEYFNLKDIVEVGVPKDFFVSQNYPNPSNPKTKIDYELPEKLQISIIIFDITGREIFTLVNKIQEAGYYSVEFDGTDLSSGVYFYKLTAGEFVKTKRMILLK
jgi:hypothetical protein